MRLCMARESVLRMSGNYKRVLRCANLSNVNRLSFEIIIRNDICLTGLKISGVFGQCMLTLCTCINMLDN